MESTINMTAVFVADYIGVLFLSIVLLTKGWNLPTRRKESIILCVLISATLFDCAIDPFVFLVDGKPGMFNRMVGLLGNSALYIYNLIVGTGMLALIVMHINKSISRFQYVVVWIITIMESVLLLINFFYPIVFSIDENNVYKRGPGYAVYIIAAFYLLGYALFVYGIAKFRDDSVRYFPVWEFVIPISLGVTIQTAFYGLSVQPVSFAVAFCVLLISLQNECIFIDKLTGVYNRYELEKILRQYSGRRIKRIGAIMIDMNDFKSINDNYSHEEGDNALVAVANILTEVIQNKGTIIRYAGDEFVVIISKAGEESLKNCCEGICRKMEEYNATSDKPYKLSAALGSDVFELGGEKGTDFLTRIDRLMYENKREYYTMHDRRNISRGNT
ncbi:MAG: GGDEF domain-containing protein [Lachnospiraceae bacterium]|nr:GGDEF domain-containing protein [Lachnospiraceae bacterium]